MCWRDHDPDMDDTLLGITLGGLAEPQPLLVPTQHEQFTSFDQVRRIAAKPTGQFLRATQAGLLKRNGTVQFARFQQTKEQVTPEAVPYTVEGGDSEAFVINLPYSFGQPAHGRRDVL